MTRKKINSALISVYHKENLVPVAKKLHNLRVKIYSTGGTKDFIEKLGIPVVAVEDLTTYPSILGGRVKTLHPKVFGGILARRDDASDKQEITDYEIPEIDLVIVDLYPFEETVRSTTNKGEIIEKIDIGGISLIRAAAKNFRDVLTVASGNQYAEFLELLEKGEGYTEITDRKQFAMKAFDTSSAYDIAIFDYFSRDFDKNTFKCHVEEHRSLRYGENPHQKGDFYGDFNDMFEQLHGKEISYNNLLDIDAAVQLIDEFDETTFAVLKHNNACGVASRDKLAEAWKDALAGDPLSAFGGVLITNKAIDEKTAEEMDKIFFEIVIAPDYDKKALEILKNKKNRIILVQNGKKEAEKQFRSVLNGVLVQDIDRKRETKADLQVMTQQKPGDDQIPDLLFANKLVKHSKSNSIVLAKNKQLLGSGVGMTSRVDALKQAISKAKEFEKDLSGAVMASDAFFPFADSVEIAHKEGITAVIQPGGSKRDKDSIEYCDKNNMIMVFTGHRHFRH